MKTLTIKLSDVQAAVLRGKAVEATWHRHDARWGSWQAEAIEIFRLPAVYARSLEMAKGRDLYGEPAPCTDITHGLPGYAMRGWSSGPREGWECGHSPSCVWDGIRRERFAGLTDALRAIAYGQDPARYQDVLSAYKVRVVAGRTRPLNPILAFA